MEYMLIDGNWDGKPYCGSHSECLRVVRIRSRRSKVAVSCYLRNCSIVPMWQQMIFPIVISGVLFFALLFN